MSYQDTTFYALLGLMASAGLTQNDVNVQQVGPTGVWQFVAEGKSQGMAGVPDWIPPVQAAGVKVKIIPTETSSRTWRRRSPPPTTSSSRSRR